MVNIVTLLSKIGNKFLLKFNPVSEKQATHTYSKGIYVKPLAGDICKVATTGSGEVLFQPIETDTISDNITLQLKSSDNVIIKVENNNIVISGTSNINASNIQLDLGGGDVLIGGKSVKQFMTTHTHTDSQGGTTTPPIT